MLQPLTPIKGQPVQGGAVTVRSPAQLPFGSYSMIQNIRGKHPNFIKRPGQKKLHTVADGTNEVLSLYQYRKSQVDESHFFVQMSDGDILEATNNPPTVTAGPFGSEVFDGSINQIPASWGVQGDKLVMSNGVDQHQIYCGTESYVEKFIVYKGPAPIPDIPAGGVDFSTEVRNDRAVYAEFSSVGALVNSGCIYICVPVPVKGFGFVIDNPNTASITAGIQYYNSHSGWVTVTGFNDGTASGGKTLAQDGDMTFTAPSVKEDDSSDGLISRYQFGKSGFWYRLAFSSYTSNDIRIKTVTFQSDFQNIINVWDGVIPPAVEVLVRIYADGAITDEHKTYGSGAVDIGNLAAQSHIIIGASDPIEGIYIDLGNTPCATEKVIRELSYWGGNGFDYIYLMDIGEGVTGAITDGTNGLRQSGWITFERKAVQTSQYKQNKNYAYWYMLVFNTIIDASVVISIDVMPYFDIRDLGISQCNTIWKDRVVYSFDQYGSYLYISKQGCPLVLNGSDYGILRAGDGRNNKTVNMKSYKDFLMVWQEEKGVDGGCVTIFSGSDPTNISRTVLSPRIGTMNAKSVAVVEGVETATSDTATSLEEKIATLVFFLSSHGVCVSNAYTISVVSDDIQNYFDPTKDECIRKGYEDKMWLVYDSAYGVLRIGLVSGSLATKANVFPVYDLADKTWSFDELGQNLACMTEIEAGSGNIPNLQVGGGQTDGMVYQLNNDLNDVTESIHSFVKIELNHNGEVLALREFLIRCEAMEYGEIIIEFLKNNIHEMHKTVSMLPDKPGEIIKRKRFSVNITDQNISIQISCGEHNTEMNLMEIGMLTSVWSGR